MASIDELRHELNERIAAEHMVKPGRLDDGHPELLTDVIQQLRREFSQLAEKVKRQQAMLDELMARSDPGNMDRALAERLNRPRGR